MVSMLIDRIDRWLKINRPEYYSCLQAGVSDVELNHFETKFAVRLPTAFRELYRWRNGQQQSCTKSFQYNRMFSSLEEIAETKEMLDDMIGSEFEDPQWWRREWIPFLANGGGDHLCLDVKAEGGGTPNQIIVFWHDCEIRSVKFPNMEAWLRDLADSMEAGTLELS